MNFRKIAAVLTFATVLVGCSQSVTTVPDNLIGVWGTSDAKYADRYFELKKVSVVFGMGAGKATTGMVTDVAQTHENNHDLYDISYTGSEGSKQKLSVYLIEPGVIKIKSQDKIEWKKNPGGVAAIAKGAPAVAAAPVDLNAKKPPVDAIKEPKKPSVPDLEEPAVVEMAETTGPNRDPFAVLHKKVTASSKPLILPPGKRGIVIDQAVLAGVVKSVDGMVAVIDANRGTYFLHPNDSVYDGKVVRINPDSIVFEEASTDPLGKPVTREIVKKIRGER